MRIRTVLPTPKGYLELRFSDLVTLVSGCWIEGPLWVQEGREVRLSQIIRSRSRMDVPLLDYAE
jgi:hypothetical protein